MVRHFYVRHFQSTHYPVQSTWLKTEEVVRAVPVAVAGGRHGLIYIGVREWWENVPIVF